MHLTGRARTELVDTNDQAFPRFGRTARNGGHDTVLSTHPLQPLTAPTSPASSACWAPPTKPLLATDAPTGAVRGWTNGTCSAQLMTCAFSQDTPWSPPAPRE